MLEHQQINTSTIPTTLVWDGDTLVDWVHGGNLYHLDGRFEHSGRGIGYKFDGVRVSPNGIYKVIFEKLGTKGLVLKESEIIREIDRSYYCAGVYEFPVCIFDLNDDTTCLVHCPNKYNELVIEEIETGKKVGHHLKRNPKDFFHSRLQVNQSNTFLISAGWFWHPYGDVRLYNLADSLVDNSNLDTYGIDLPIIGEVCSAQFISKTKLLVSLTNEPVLDDEITETEDVLFPLQIGIIDLKTLKLEKKVQLKEETGDLLPIDENTAWSLFDHPKIIDLNTGEVRYEFKELNTGKKDSPIIHYLDFLPTYAYDSLHRRLAVATKEGISILTYYE
ncbi:MAG: hypothetical protein P1U56_19005 [Saprospiraceae bacterium]|nr:hypothetical protein [Saprospiraceae bacterium]